MKNHRKKFFVYNILHKTSIGGKPLPIRFYKGLDKGFIRVYDRTRYF